MKDSRGVDWYKWTLRPGAENHWLDTTSGCFAMASWYRLLDDAESAAVGVAAAAAPEDDAGDGRRAFSVPLREPHTAPQAAPRHVRRAVPRRRPRLLRSTVA